MAATSPAPKPVPEKPVPPPNPVQKEKDELFQQIVTVVEGLLPNVGKETGKLKKAVESFKSIIQKAGSEQVKEVKNELAAAITAIENKQGSVEELLVQKLDDWASMLGADPAIVAGLKILGLPETMDFLKKLMDGWKNFQKGETHITMHYRTFVLGWLGTIIVTAFVFGWIGTMI